MFRKRKYKAMREEANSQLLDHIERLKNERLYLRKIMEHSIEASEDGRLDVAMTEAKYFYLLREARQRNVRAR
ncbi:hypothetical protein N781_00010 [Pontibacillus halophilus JSM 076056 = DSM 19796]|uniref:DUF2508 family protein n=1 Tax=Pontibacillus halophilus JSM 076056 = DSM 19796 TaxID=1385510 RepID=A0A0A5GS41_9BACI|nr:YaaL family protein [Pontibacillus halophilus]KGX94038.1 hypothetical protein N781_00010 [Pontibacillus halophilus JSM 076056 = DSM 19796]